jgi:putative ABC transport system permease protein
MLKNWTLIAFRNFRKNLFFTLINILGLTIGMVGIILVSLYWNDELMYNQWNPEKENVFAVSHEFDWSGTSSYMSISPIPEGPAIKETFDEVEDYLVVGWLRNGVVKTDNKTVYLKDYLPVTPNFFSFFPYDFIYGSGSNALANQQSIAISDEWMEALYDGKNPVGKKLFIGQKEYIVSGVYKIPGFSSINPKALTVMDWKKQLDENATNWATYQTGIYLKIKNGTDIPQLEKKIYNQITMKKAIEPFAEMQKLSVEDYIDKYGGANLALDKLATIRLFGKGEGSGGAVKGNLTMLYLLSGLTFIIMILSAFNYINLSTASSIKRAKEVGIRKTLGASKGKLGVQFVLESFMISLFSLILALALAEIILPFFNEYFEKDLKIQGVKIYRDLLIILLAITLISGLIPAIYLANFQPLKVLKGNFSRSNKGIWFRNLMLGLQFIVSLFFMIAGIIIYLQVEFMTKKDLGFKGDQVVAVQLSNLTNNVTYPVIAQEFSKIPGVKQVSSGFMIPALSNHVGGSAESEKTGKAVDLALAGAMDYNFLDILNIQLKEGRNISPEFASDTIDNVLVNETLVKRLNLENPIGEEISFSPAEKKFKIIGVVKDYYVSNFKAEIEPVIYFHWNTISWTKDQMNYVLMKVDGNDIEKVIAEIEKKWKSEVMVEGAPFTYHFVDQKFADTYKEFQRQKNLFAVLTFVAISIALLGLFGLISLVVEQRMKEISIRKILGASQKNLVQLVGKEYLMIAMVSFVICVPVTYYLIQKWLEEFAYRIDIPIWPFIVSLFSLLLLVFLIIFLRTMYAMKVNPINYLKYE